MLIRGSDLPWSHTEADPYCGHEAASDPVVGEEMDFEVSDPYSNPTH